MCNVVPKDRRTCPQNVYVGTQKLEADLICRLTLERFDRALTKADEVESVRCLSCWTAFPNCACEAEVG